MPPNHPTLCLEDSRSFQLSYGRVACNCLSLRLLSYLSQPGTEARCRLLALPAMQLKS
jgi:hypothetical protein